MGQYSEKIRFSRAELIGATVTLCLLAVALAPQTADYVEQRRIERATADAERIANAVILYRSDTGHWPGALEHSTPIDRLVTSSRLAKGAGAGARSGAANWGDYGHAVQLGKFLHEPSDATSATRGDDPTAADGDDHGVWRGPYLERFSMSDPWGNAYVINARYLPAGKYAGKERHKVLVLSPGPDQKWQTPYSDGATEDTHGDDIARLILVTN